jgi:bifunctional non-homologous end joining protein LigD
MITPMLAAAGPLPADSGKWAYEVKWDGFRALVEATPDLVTIRSRNGYDMTNRYPELDGLSDAVSTTALLDGEIVALDAENRPDFAALWSAVGVRRIQRRVFASWRSMSSSSVGRS